ncbi:hypothetical protein [Dyella sp.]|uniref:hypothetical protein n=1 Tax=Dyella sp. TaxID=1869338 RepID=UPI002ED41AC9
MKASVWWLACLAGLGMTMPAHAVGRLIDVTVVDRDTGVELPLYNHHGRYYLIGEPGHHYRIDLRNTSRERVLGVVSVDGVNAITGDTASWSQSGYLLDGHGMFGVLGWRKSEQQVADFLFTDLAQSYAARTGRPQNVGVIGVAVFRELRLPPPPPVYETVKPSMASAAPRARATDGAAPEPAKAMPSINQTQMAAPSRIVVPPRDMSMAPPLDDKGPLGTGHGAREDSQVHTVDFQRATRRPEDIVTIYYDTRERLIAQGVIPPFRDIRPQAFPGRFAADP